MVAIKTHRENLTVRHLSDTHLLQSSHHRVVGVPPNPHEGEQRLEERAPGSDLSQGGRPGVLSGDPGQVAARTPGFRPSPDSPIGAHDRGPLPSTRTGRSPRRVAVPFPRLQGLQEMPWPAGSPANSQEAGDRHLPGNSEPPVLEKGRHGDTRDKIRAVEWTSVHKVQDKEETGKRRKRQKKKRTVGILVCGQGRIWDVRGVLCVMQWSRDTPEGEVPRGCCARPCLTPGPSAFTCPSFRRRTGRIDHPERAPSRSQFLSCRECFWLVGPHCRCQLAPTDFVLPETRWTLKS